MADKGFRLTVFTQEKAVLDQQVLSIVAPGSEGYLGVLRDHAPLVTQLMPGKLTVKDLGGNATVYVVSGGFLEVNHNTVTILADALERPEDIDVEPRGGRGAKGAGVAGEAQHGHRRGSRRGRPAPGAESPQGAPRRPVGALGPWARARFPAGAATLSSRQPSQLSTAVLSAFMNSEPSARPGATWRRPSRITSTTSA